MFSYASRYVGKDFDVDKAKKDVIETIQPMVLAC